MVVGIILFIGLVGLWVWSEVERNRREDELKERIIHLERWLESIQKEHKSNGGKYFY